MRILPAVLLWLVAACAPAAAQESVIYRCTDAAGNLTVQNKPCPAGQQQQVRRLQALPSVPPPTAAPRAAAPTAAPPAGDFELVRGPVEATSTASPVPAAERTPPPPLFQCTTHDQDRYLSESGTPAPTCVPLETPGVGGDARSVMACEMHTDSCEPVAAQDACRAWKRRVDEAEFRWRFARAENDDPRRAEYERLAKIWRESECAG
jgi:hypothetical protein